MFPSHIEMKVHAKNQAEIRIPMIHDYSIL